MRIYLEEKIGVGTFQQNGLRPVASLLREHGYRGSEVALAHSPLRERLVVLGINDKVFRADDVV